MTDHDARTRSVRSAVVVCCVAIFLLASPVDASRDLPDSFAPAIAGPVAGPADFDRNLPVRPRLPLFSAADILALSYGYDGPDQLLQLTSGRGSVGHHFFQGLWTDPVTGISYARNRWYDARTASWLSEDPKGAVDSPNLYAAFALSPHVFTDPMGSNVESAEVPCTMIEIGCNPNTGTKHVDYKGHLDQPIQPAYSPAAEETMRDRLVFAIPPASTIESNSEADDAIAIFASQLAFDTASDGFEVLTGYSFSDPDQKLTGLQYCGSVTMLALPGLCRGALETGASLSQQVARKSDEVIEALSLRQQRELAKLAKETRNEMIADFDLILPLLKEDELTAIAKKPQLMNMFFGTALEVRMAEKIDAINRLDPGGVLSDIKWTGRTNAPFDFYNGGGFRFEVTGGSLSSIRSHTAREAVDTVVTYDSIPGDLAYRFIDWLGE